MKRPVTCAGCVRSFLAGVAAEGECKPLWFRDGILYFGPNRAIARRVVTLSGAVTVLVLRMYFSADRKASKWSSLVTSEAAAAGVNTMPLPKIPAGRSAQEAVDAIDDLVATFQTCIRSARSPANVAHFQTQLVAVRDNQHRLLNLWRDKLPYG